jgi:hypothetical protein
VEQEYIDFKRNGELLRKNIHKKCSNCTQNCKQHKIIKIMKCSNYINKAEKNEN